MASQLYYFTPEQLQYILDTSNSYADVLRKCKMAEHGANPETLKRIIKEYGLSEDQLNQNRSNLFAKCAQKTHDKLRIPLQDVFDNKAKMQGGKLIKRMVEEGYKEYKCEKCGLTKWLGNPISLQLHHKDGNHYNNSLDNIEILCPNCHSQTDTFAGKNIKNINSSCEESDIKKRLNSIRVPCKKCNSLCHPKEDGLCTACKKALKSRSSNPDYKVESVVYMFEEEHKSFKEISKIFNLAINIIIHDYTKYKGKETLRDVFVTRDSLKELIRVKPFIQIAKDFGVSDKAIEKWCITFGLPYKYRDIHDLSDEEWAKI